MSLAQWLDQMATVQARSTAQGATGGVSPTWGNRLTGVACAVWPADAKTVLDFGIQDLVNGYVVCTQVDISATADDRIVIGAGTYGVRGYKRFINARLSSSPLYITLVELRNQ